MADVFDLDALAVEEEQAEPFRFRWNAHEFSIPLLTQLPWQASVRYFTEGLAPAERLRLLLGDEQYESFVAQPMSAARLNALLDAWLAAQGTSVGESGASSPS